ncbi:MAG: guanyltransferase [Chloroflexi bacterium]|nr:guanyltransferase [Chloroflexota bacterium]|tara:strand:- start:2068 stop:2775 length:708 start_codon:yes stop_codon:yes gene_type:complete
MERNRPTTALILAGGRGERLRPLTDDRPKPMVLVEGKPIIQYQLEWLRNNGVTKAFLLTGYLHEVIENYFASKSIPDLEVQCIKEDSPLGRGGAFKHGYHMAGINDPLVYASNGDIFTTVSFDDLCTMHSNKQAMATIALTPMISPYGVVDTHEDTVTGFKEKPQLPYWINSGAYLLNKETIDLFPDRGDHETNVFPDLAQKGKLAALKSHAFWRSLETLKDLDIIGDFLKTNKN